MQTTLAGLLSLKFGLPPSVAKAHATDIIAKLGLKQEWGALDGEDNGFLADSRDELKPSPREAIKTRWITSWQDDEEEGSSQ